MQTKTVVHGGSNGAAMALLYASKYPETVSGVVLRGYWSMTLDHLIWNYLGAHGKRLFYPTEWHAVCDSVHFSKFESSNETYFDLLIKLNQELIGPEGDELCENQPSSDPCTKVLSTACSFLRYDAAGSSVKAIPNDQCHLDKGTNPAWYQLHPVAAARIGIHLYLENMNNPIPDIADLARQKVPVNFIHGRYDMLCPPDFGYEMVAKAKNSGVETKLWKITVVEHAAHSAHDEGMTEAIQDALRKIIQI